MVGLGGSVSGDITAEAIVVTSFEDLEIKQHLVRGKIVIYSVPWINYAETGQYRRNGAVRAGKIKQRIIIVETFRRKNYISKLEDIHITTLTL